MFGSAVCQICTDQYDAEKPIAAMPCGHTFHDDCLSRWLLTTRNCPSCRKPLKKSQNPIHRLFFSLEHSGCSPAGASQKSQDSALLEKNRKLQVQVTSLQAAIEKFKVECQDADSEKAALSYALSNKSSEIEMLEKTQEKLKRKIREFTVKQSELVGIKDELSHLRNVQTIVQGVEKDVVKMLEEKVGYTPQQLTYVVLLRQQLSNSKKTCEKLKREIGECRESLLSYQRKYESSEAELNLLKLELGKSEAHNLALEKKCKKLINSINSPSGISVSLAKRIVHQSPAPMFITPSPSEKPSSVNEKLSEAEDNLKTRLSYGNNGDEEDSYMPVPKVAKKSKYIESKSDLTQGRKDAGDVTPPVNQSALPIKPNNSLKFKAYRRKNVLQEFKRNKNSTYESKYFRHGFDGMGGQTQSYNRTQDAMQFNIFKKSAKRQEKTISSTHKYIPEEVILIE